MSEDPWPAMRKEIIEKLAKAPKPRPKPDYRKLYWQRKRREQEKE